MSGRIERERVKQAYPKSKAWASKVDKMTDSQVTAIFLRMKRERKILCL